MKKITLALLCVIVATGILRAQDMPTSFNHSQVSRDVPTEMMPTLDVATLMAEDEMNMTDKVGPYKFGENMQVDLDLGNCGRWEELKKGRLWRVGIRSAESFSLNFIFNDLFIPQGGTVHLYNADRTEVLGPYTGADNREDRGFATFPIPGELVFIEYYEPYAVLGQGSISIETVTHAYRDIFTYYSSARVEAAIREDVTEKERVEKAEERIQEGIIRATEDEVERLTGKRVRFEEEDAGRKEQRTSGSASSSDATGSPSGVASRTAAAGDAEKEPIPEPTPEPVVMTNEEAENLGRKLKREDREEEEVARKQKGRRSVRGTDENISEIEDLMMKRTQMPSETKRCV